ncbi:MAG: hydrogenase maturation protease [Chloroflexota bacterium]
MTAGHLVIGYGNGLRSDDGVGPEVAARLARDARLRDAIVIAGHQLTPELALDVSKSTHVVFIDASTAVPAGQVVVRRLSPATGGSAWTHHVTPERLVAMASELYGAAPGATLVSVGVASLEAGEALSPVVAAVVDDVVEAVVRIVRNVQAPVRA